MMTKGQIMTESLVKSLNSQLLNAQKAYYAGTPSIPDGEYDSLEAQLTSLIESHPQFSPLATVLVNVGDSKNSASRIPHERPMLSIENYYTVESFVGAAKTYGDYVLVEPKRDGISCELKYENGKLFQAVTRGDGNSGEEMTLQVKHCKAIPQTISSKLSLRIRGELVMNNSELARINSLGGKQYANSRNLTAGTMKNDDVTIVESRNVFLIPWDVFSPNEDSKLPDSAFERMKLVESFGFPKYEGYRIMNCGNGMLESILESVLESNKKSDVVADGVVVKADSHLVRNKLGCKSKYTNFQCDFKPQNTSSETTLVGIEYGLGRTGKVTPVAILEPVNLGGAMVSRASLNNETYMTALGIRLGCKVNVLRSGEVIPFISAVTDITNSTPFVFPTTCPSCNSKLKMDPSAAIVQRFCDNSSCPGKAAEHFSYIGNRETLEIDNLGDSMAAELVESGITSVADLFEFGNKNRNVLASGFKRGGWYSGANVVKMVKSLENAKTATWDRWFPVLGIELVGHSLGKDIAKTLNLTSEDMKNLPSLLLTLPKIGMDKLGEVKMNAIVEWATNQNNVDLCTRLYNAGVRPTSLTVKNNNGGNMKLDGIKFVCTGTLPQGSRKEISAQLVKLGAEELSSITSACNLLIAGEDCGSKLEKAQAKGIKIVGADWVDEVLGN
jgi:DNA ligase (NAD+)